MKFFLLLILFSMAVVSQADHSLNESIHMVETEQVNRKLMTVKFKDIEGHQSSIFARNSFWKFLSRNSADLTPLFVNVHEGNVKTLYEKNLLTYRMVKFQNELDKGNAIETLKMLNSDPYVEFAFFEPFMEDAVLETRETKANISYLQETPDFESMQNHLNAAPDGINARYGWELPGGAGGNVRIIDIESGFIRNHEDLGEPFWVGPDSDKQTDHGLAVLGELTAKRDGKGVTGIVYDAKFGFIARTSNNDAPYPTDEYHANIARVIEQALTQLEAGDLLVLEMHSAGPTNNFIPVEYWKPIYDILLVAKERGILCAAAAGNGYQDLDDAAFEGAFDLNVRNSDCVIVGAATNSPDGETRTRASFSNYGSRVDAFGYGRNVVTTGYGDLFNGGDRTTMYTKRFSGTSSATPIVGGAMASLSSWAQQNDGLISPSQMREALRETGTPQEGDVSQRIGNLPDIKALHEFFVK